LLRWVASRTFKLLKKKHLLVTQLKKPQKKSPPKKESHYSLKSLYRDNNRKLLAGVLAGIAYYFNIDPLWIRLLYVLLFFGISILPSIAGFLFIAYIVMWIVIPASDELKEEKKIKKMYRDPDGKVLGECGQWYRCIFWC
jgi:phage shock protein PspC (stress-responsive transcriptional regulator)